MGFCWICLVQQRKIERGICRSRRVLWLDSVCCNSKKKKVSKWNISSFFIFFFPLARESQGKLLFCLTWNKNIFSGFFPWVWKAVFVTWGLFYASLPNLTRTSTWMFQHPSRNPLPAKLCKLQFISGSTSYMGEWIESWRCSHAM